MVLSLIFGKKYAKGQVQDAQNGSSIVTFDTTISEDHKFTSRVTFFPIESGTIVSDHIINQPDVVTISGFVTDTPLNIFAGFNRSISAFNSLIQIHERRQIVDLITGIKIYKNMALTSMSVPRTIQTGQTLTFNLEFQRIVYDNDLQNSLVQGNVFGGVTDNLPRNLISENTNIPLLQNDPPFSLKDQSETAVNQGVQSLDPVPAGSVPNVTTNAAVIYGIQ